MTDRHDRAAIVITDVPPSVDAQQTHRRHVYVAIMMVHLVGFALSYPLYLWRPWAGAVMVIATGALPWVAVLLANDGPPRARPRAQRIETPTETGNKASPGAQPEVNAMPPYVISPRERN